MNTPDRLVLRDFPAALAAVLTGTVAMCGLMAWGYFRAGETAGGFVMLGIGALLLIPIATFARLTVITADRARGRIRVTHLGIAGLRRADLPLDGATGATFETAVTKPNPVDHKHGSRRRPPDIRAHRPVLIYADGRRLPIVQTYTPLSRAGSVSGALNGWLRKPGA